MLSRLTLGTRASPLATVQAKTIARALTPAPRIVTIQTQGDAITDRPLRTMGGKGLFVKALDQALLAGTIDIAVHALKDMEAHLPEGLLLAAVPEREDPRDVWIHRDGTPYHALPAGALVGTASPRRQAQLLHHNRTLEVVTLRGNVATRLEKLRTGDITGTFLALAGLRRLGLQCQHARTLEPAEMLSAVGQGALAVVCRQDDAKTLEALAPLDHSPSRWAVAAERAMLRALDGSCFTPIGGLAQWHGDDLVLEGLVAMMDGSRLERLRRASPVSTQAEAEALGAALGEALRARFSPDAWQALIGCHP